MYNYTIMFKISNIVKITFLKSFCNINVAFFPCHDALIFTLKTRFYYYYIIPAFKNINGNIWMKR